MGHLLPAHGFAAPWPGCSWGHRRLSPASLFLPGTSFPTSFPGCLIRVPAYTLVCLLMWDPKTLPTNLFTRSVSSRRSGEAGCVPRAWHVGGAQFMPVGHLLSARGAPKGGLCPAGTIREDFLEEGVSGGGLGKWEVWCQIRTDSKCCRFWVLYDLFFNCSVLPLECKSSPRHY